MAVVGGVQQARLSSDEEPLHQHDLPVLRAMTRNHVAEHDEKRTGLYEVSEVSGIVQRAYDDADEDQ
jgi:hypothetical protein